MNVNELLQFLNASPTCFQAVDHIRRILMDNGYEEVNDSYDMCHRGGKYFTIRNRSSLIAWRIPDREITGFMIGASHCDSPSFKLKENPEMVNDGYVKLNVEGYGGMLMGTWLDRPLSIAGRLIVKQNDTYRTVLVNVDEDLLVIPSLAIHMKRDANTNQTWNPQVDLCPVIGSEEAKGTVMKKAAEYAGVREEDIIGHDLFLYIREEGRVIGARKEYISAPHLDDLQCTYGDLQGFLKSEEGCSIPVLAVFDNEEVGSLTKQGASGDFLFTVLHQIAENCQKDYAVMLRNSFMVSADNAHAVHPNHPEKADPVNRPKMNAGIVLKFNAAQHYTTDGVSAAIFRDICRMADVPVQVFTNRSDERGGGTLGNLANANVSLNTVDIGLAQLAMHSCYETAGIKDTEYLETAMAKFFSSALKDTGDGSYQLVKE